jgi:hypothetical protein
MQPSATVTVKWGKQSFSYDCLDLSTPNGAVQLKARLFDSTGVDPANQRLIIDGKVLKDGGSLETYGVKNGSVLQMMGRAPAVGGAVQSAILPVPSPSDPDICAAGISTPDIIHKIMAGLIESARFARLVQVVFDPRGEFAQYDESSPCQGGEMTPKEELQLFFARLLVRAAALRWPFFAQSEVKNMTMLPILSEECDVKAERENFIEYLLKETSGSISIACGDFVKSIWDESIPLECDHNFDGVQSTDALLARQISEIAVLLQPAAMQQLKTLQNVFSGGSHCVGSIDDCAFPSEESVVSDGIDPEEFENVRHYLPLLCTSC